MVPQNCTKCGKPAAWLVYEGDHRRCRPCRAVAVKCTLTDQQSAWLAFNLSAQSRIRKILADETRVCRLWIRETGTNPPAMPDPRT